MGRMQRTVGFTLVELLAAIVIVGVLVTLAVPRYRVFIAKARQSEASVNLGIIAKLQQSYYNEYGKYYNESSFKMGTGGGGSCPSAGDDANELGFRTIKCSKLRYTYTSRSGGGGGAKNDGSDDSLLIYPGCSNQIDEWHINIERDLTNHQKVIKKCQD